MLVRVYAGDHRDRYVALPVQPRDSIAETADRGARLLGLDGRYTLRRNLYDLPRELLAWESLADCIDVQLVLAPTEVRA